MKLRQLNPSKQSLYAALSLSLCLCLHSATASEHAGQVVSVSGKVLIRSEASQTMQMTFLKPGDKILKGSIVNTGSNGSAKLMMTDKTIIDLGPSSLFRVNEYKLNGGADRKVDVSVDYGQIRASVNQKVNSDKGKFTIRTKAATMGVRGTEFVVNAGLQQGSGGKPQTSVTVLEGRVDVADLKTPNAPVRIEPGMQFVKTGDGAPNVARLDLQQLSQVRSDAFQKDMTFLQAVVIEPASEQNSAPPAPPAKGVRERMADGSTSPDDRAGDQTGDQKTDQSTEQKTAASDSGDVQGPAPASAPPPPPTGNLTMRAIVDNVAVNTGAMVPINVTDMRLPGVIAAPVVPPQGVQILQGLPRNLQINFNPN